VKVVESVPLVNCFGLLKDVQVMDLLPFLVMLPLKGTDSTTFTYGPDRSRYQKVQTRSSDNTTITTQYFGKVYEKIKQNTSTEHKYFIYSPKAA
jgi:hypothetical protein